MAKHAPVIIISIVMLIGILKRFVPSAGMVLNYLPDLMMAGFGLIVLFRLIIKKSWVSIPPSYFFVFSGFLYVIVAGAVLNDVSGDTIFAGIRTYFMAMPMFLAPFAFEYQVEDLRRIEKVILALLLLQIPVTLTQKFWLYTSQHQADLISGTFPITSELSIVCCSAIVYLIVQYLGKRISLLTLSSLGVCLLIPPVLAETKVTPIFLAIGVVASLYAFRKQIQLKQFAAIGVAIALLMTIFISLHSYLYPTRTAGAGYITAMKDNQYHLRDITIPDLTLPLKDTRNVIGEQRIDIGGDHADSEFGRLNSISAPFQALYPNSTTFLVLGLGLGNVTSDFGRGGQYFDTIGARFNANHVTMSHVVWETGIAGLAFFAAFYLLILFDARKAPHSDHPWELFRASVFAVFSITVASLLYTNILYKPTVIFPILFVAGLFLRHMTTETASRKAGSLPLLDGGSTK